MLRIHILSIILAVCSVITCSLWWKCVFTGWSFDGILRRVNFDLIPQPPNINGGLSSVNKCAQRKLWSVRPSLSICYSSDHRSDINENNDNNEGVGKCPRGSFILNGMSTCHPWLKCEDYVTNVVLISKIGRGAVKQVYKGVWKGHLVAVSVPLVISGQIIHWNDFDHGREMLQRLGPSKHLVQLVGYCDGDPPVLVTEYHRYGSADTVDGLFGTLPPPSLSVRFRFCLDYVEILSWLHSSPIGVRVMCDTNDLKKTLEQYLVTDELRLVLNDVDAIPQVDRHSGQLVKCGHERLYGRFVAPEQLWPHADREYDDGEMHGYDERTDVWKIPDVCEFFLSGSFEGDSERVLLSYRLFRIHGKCKSVEPETRPTAEQVLREYRNIWSELYDK